MVIPPSDRPSRAPARKLRPNVPERALEGVSRDVQRGTNWLGGQGALYTWRRAATDTGVDPV